MIEPRLPGLEGRSSTTTSGRGPSRSSCRPLHAQLDERDQLPRLGFLGQLREQLRRQLDVAPCPGAVDHRARPRRERRPRGVQTDSNAQPFAIALSIALTLWTMKRPCRARCLRLVSSAAVSWYSSLAVRIAWRCGIR